MVLVTAVVFTAPKPPKAPRPELVPNPNPVVAVEVDPSNVVVVVAAVLVLNNPPPKVRLAPGVPPRVNPVLCPPWPVCPNTPRVGTVVVVFAAFKPVATVEPRPPKVKGEVPAVVVVARCPNGVLKVDAVVVTPNGFIAEKPLVPRVPVPEVLAPRVGVPNDVEEVPLPNVKPVEPPPNTPVVAAAILLPHRMRKQPIKMFVRKVISLHHGRCECTFPIWRWKDEEAFSKKGNFPSKKKPD